MTSPGNSKNNYQRLEFLGDRVLNLIISDYLYRENVEASEGELTQKLQFTSNDNLNEILERLDENILEKIVTFKSGYQPGNPDLSADDLEAFIGKFYLEHGFTEARNLVEKMLAGEVDRFDPNKDYISGLQIYAQKNLKSVPEYLDMNDKKVLNNEHEFQVRVLIGGKIYGEGSGNRKSRARNQAALAALRNLGLMP